jgi:hypothetical protein
MKSIIIKTSLYLPIGPYLKIGSANDWDEEFDWKIVKVVEQRYNDIIVLCYASKTEIHKNIDGSIPTRAFQTVYTYEEKLKHSEIRIVRKFIPEDAPKIINWIWMSNKFKKEFQIQTQ